MAKSKMDQAFLRAAMQHHQAGRLADAEQMYREVLREDPKNANALHMLGVLCAQSGRVDVAIDLLKRAVSVTPKQAEVHFNLGNALREKGQLTRAVACYQKAVELNPRLIAACENLAIAWHNTGELDESIQTFRQCLQLKPDSAELRFKLGNVLWACGFAREAVSAYREALAREPQHLLAYDNLLLAMQYDFAADAKVIHEEHRRWADSQARVAAVPRPIDPKITERRSQIASGHAKLRIGYVSSDLRNHPVGRFMAPLLANHDRTAFEIFCYSNAVTGEAPDAVERRLRAFGDPWKSITGRSDEQAAQMIAQDGIDILVDLNMHSQGNRLLVFARKPAPIQVTYLAYGSTTGLEAVGYRLTDSFFDPPEHDDGRYSEESWRLPETYWCYQQDEAATPATSELPAGRAGRIVLGCLNNAMKVSDEAIETWARIMAAVPDSQLIVHARFKAQRERIVGRLVGLGIAENRCKFPAHMPERDYFDQYGKIDIALDPFPFAGGTTTCDALWMGVPVVTLAGHTAAGRGGVSILSNVGLPELIARTREEYVRIAVELAGDLPRLGRLRSELRGRMRQSALMDGPRFARAVEDAYRGMWRKCFAAAARADT